MADQAAMARTAIEADRIAGQAPAQVAIAVVVDTVAAEAAGEVALEAAAPAVAETVVVDALGKFGLDVL